MTEKAVWDAIDRYFDGKLDLSSRCSVAGGDINDSYAVKTHSGERYFVKINAEPDLLLTEQLNLQHLAGSAVRTPEPVYFTVEEGTAGLVLEHLALRPGGDEYALGQQLAQMHGRIGQTFGLDYDNYIGATAQRNESRTHWVDFWADCRLAPQLDRALAAGYSLGVDKAALLRACRDMLADHHPEPALLHGDLWAGNKAFLADGTPVLFDPAVYYGDRETDIGFTRIFGGFGPEFYRGYEATWPLTDGWQARQPLYNLYHLLNHLNLFGGGYLGSVQQLASEVTGN